MLFLLFSITIHLILIQAKQLNTNVETAIATFDETSAKINHNQLDMHSYFRKLRELRIEITNQYQVNLDEFIERHHDKHNRLLEDVSLSKQLCQNVSVKATNLPILADWMGSLPSKVKSQNIKSIVFPGTHDSAAYELNYQYNVNDPGAKEILEKTKDFPATFIFPFYCRFALAQDMNTLEQLNHGIRYFDLRPSYDATTGTWRNAHFLFGVGMTEIFKDIKSFLDEHKKEIVLIEMTNFYGGKTEAIKNELKLSVLNTFKGLLVNKDQVLTLSIEQLVKANQRVIVAAQDPIVSSDPSINDGTLIHNTYAGTTAVGTMLSFNQLQMAKFKEHRDSSLYKISWTLTPDESFIRSNPFGSLYDLSETANKVLNDFATNFSSNGTARIGNILIIDFFEHSPIMQVLGISGESSEPSLNENSSETPSTQSFGAPTMNTSSVITTLIAMIVVVMCIQY